MKSLSYLRLSRRERQMMDVIYQKRQATAKDVMDGLSDPPSYSAVRAKLSILVEKGFLTREYDGPRYIYRPTVLPEKAHNSTMKHMLKTFFDGSVEQAMTALIGLKQAGLTKGEKTRLARLIEDAPEESDRE